MKHLILYTVFSIIYSANVEAAKDVPVNNAPLTLENFHYCSDIENLGFRLDYPQHPPSVEVSPEIGLYDRQLLLDLIAKIEGNTEVGLEDINETDKKEIIKKLQFENKMLLELLPVVESAIVTLRSGVVKSKIQYKELMSNDNVIGQLIDAILVAPMKQLQIQVLSDATKKLSDLQICLKGRSHANHLYLKLIQ